MMKLNGDLELLYEYIKSDIDKLEAKLDEHIKISREIEIELSEKISRLEEAQSWIKWLLAGVVSSIGLLGGLGYL